MPIGEIRFQELVKRSGKPQIVSLWGDPRRDRSFMNAVKENRVLTLMQEPASKKRDFGRIGFHQEPYVSYLVFPQSLPSDRGSRIIGIKYDLIEQPRVSDPVKWPSGVASQRTRTGRAERAFEVVVRREAAIETLIRVKARTESGARKQALSAANREAFDPTKAIVRNNVRSVSAARSAGPWKNGE